MNRTLIAAMMLVAGNGGRGKKTKVIETVSEPRCFGEASSSASVSKQVSKQRSHFIIRLVSFETKAAGQAPTTPPVQESCRLSAVSATCRVGETAHAQGGLPVPIAHASQTAGSLWLVHMLPVHFRRAHSRKTRRVTESWEHLVQ